MKEVKFIQKLIETKTPFLIMQHQIQIGDFSGKDPEWLLVVEENTEEVKFKRTNLESHLYSRIIQNVEWVKSICKNGHSAPNGVVYDFNNFKDKMLNTGKYSFS